MRRSIFIIGVIFVVVLAVMISVKISADAMAVIIGIVCGILASIPTSVILVWMLRQRDRQLELQVGQSRMGGGYPPVVVVNGQTPNGYGSSMPALTTGTSLPGSRDFKVVGQENTEATGDVLPSFWDQV